MKTKTKWILPHRVLDRNHNRKHWHQQHQKRRTYINDVLYIYIEVGKCKWKRMRITKLKIIWKTGSKHIEKKKLKTHSLSIFVGVSEQNCEPYFKSTVCIYIDWCVGREGSQWWCCCSQTLRTNRPSTARESSEFLTRQRDMGGGSYQTIKMRSMNLHVFTLPPFENKKIKKIECFLPG